MIDPGLRWCSRVGSRHCHTSGKPRFDAPVRCHRVLGVINEYRPYRRLQQAELGVSGLLARQGRTDLLAHGGIEVGQER